jgi:hypothetical protein
VTRVAGTSREDQYTCVIVPRSGLRMTNVTDKIRRENQNTHSVFNNFFSKILPFMR